MSFSFHLPHRAVPPVVLGPVCKHTEFRGTCAACQQARQLRWAAQLEAVHGGTGGERRAA